MQQLILYKKDHRKPKMYSPEVAQLEEQSTVEAYTHRHRLVAGSNPALGNN